VTHYFRPSASEAAGRYYEDDELALFRSYREYRAQQRPATCRGAEVCWVDWSRATG